MSASSLPRCSNCGNERGPWRPSGAVLPSGEQLFVCQDGCPVVSPELADAVAEHGPFPMPVGTTTVPLKPEREQIRAELTAEFVAWLVKKAREHRAQGPQYAKQADVIGKLASKVSRGAVRPNNLLSLPAQGGPEDVPALLAEVSRLSNELTGCNLSLYEEELDTARLRLALKAAKRGRSDARAEFYGEQAQHRTTVEQRNEHVRELVRLRARVAELEARPLAWAESLDMKSLDNFLIELDRATEYEPMDGAIAAIHQMLAQWQELVKSKAPEPDPQAALRGRERIDATAAADAEATHWKRLGVTSPEDPHDSPLRHRYDTPRDLPEYLYCGADLGGTTFPYTCHRQVGHAEGCRPLPDLPEVPQ